VVTIHQATYAGSKILIHRFHGLTRDATSTSRGQTLRDVSKPMCRRIRQNTHLSISAGLGRGRLSASVLVLLLLETCLGFLHHPTMTRMTMSTVSSAPKTVLSVGPEELGSLLEGRGRARMVWRAVAAGRDPFDPTEVGTNHFKPDVWTSRDWKRVLQEKAAFASHSFRRSSYLSF
jgi:hypothetical protein